MGIAHILKTVEYSKMTVAVSDETLARMQKILLEMMKDIAAVLDEEKINWCLSGGSVLGAIRHQGFIPWDDDIDIFMLRSEFCKFQRVFDNKLSDKYVLKIPGDKGYLFNMPQIQKKGTVLTPIQAVDGDSEGLALDIFILENTYNNKILRIIHGIKSTALLFIDSSLRMEKCKKHILTCTNNDITVEKEVNKRARFAKIFKFHSLEKWLKISDEWFSHVKKKTDYVVCPSGSKHFFGEIYKRDLFENPYNAKFETEVWKLPNPPEDYLNFRYGNDYMTIPPKKERERHVYSKIDLGREN